MRKFLAVLLLVCCAACVSAQVPTDVPKDHWAYGALDQMVSSGYLTGYPDGMFHGDRALTRYEIATIVKRVLDEVNARVDAASKSVPTVTPVTPTVTPAPAVTPAATEVTKEDLATISKLVNEFKVELVVIGTRLDTIEEALAEFKLKLDSIDAIVTDPEGAFETMKADVSKLKKVTLSGYVQTRYQTSNYDKEDEINDTYDTFLVRRARIKATAKMGERSGAVLQLDLGKNAVSVKDAYMTYAFDGNPEIGPQFQIGQQNWWFGYEVPYSSSKRETPERALFTRRFFPGERDQGAALFGPTSKKVTWVAGVYNGTGTEKNSASDLNNAKDQLLRLQYHADAFDLGVSGYNGKGAWKKFGEAATYMSTTEKVRYGADIQYYMNAITLKAEYIRAKGMDEAASSFDQSKWLDGYYAQLNYNLTTKDTFVARYSTLSEDPVKPAYGRRSAWEFGAIRWLDNNSRVKLFYKKNIEQFDTTNVLSDNNVLVGEFVVTY